MTAMGFVAFYICHNVFLINKRDELFGSHTGESSWQQCEGLCVGS